MVLCVGVCMLMGVYVYYCVCEWVWGLLKFVYVEGVWCACMWVHVEVYSCVWRVCGVYLGSCVVYLVCSCVRVCERVVCVRQSNYRNNIGIDKLCDSCANVDVYECNVNWA